MFTNTFIIRSDSDGSASSSKCISVYCSHECALVSWGICIDFDAHKEPPSSLPLQVRLECLSVCDNKIICWHWLSVCHRTGKQGWKQVAGEQASSLNKHLLQSGLSVACSHVNAVLPLYIKPVWAKGWQHVVNSECQAVCACAVGRMCVCGLGHMDEEGEIIAFRSVVACRCMHMAEVTDREAAAEDFI